LKKRENARRKPRLIRRIKNRVCERILRRRRNKNPLSVIQEDLEEFEMDSSHNELSQRHIADNRAKEPPAEF
jgi:hypothetical protein